MVFIFMESEIVCENAAIHFSRHCCFRITPNVKTCVVVLLRHIFYFLCLGCRTNRCNIFVVSLHPVTENCLISTFLSLTNKCAVFKVSFIWAVRLRQVYCRPLL